MHPEWVAGYIGLEFEHLGRGPRFDCYGLVRHVLEREFGVRVPEYGTVHGADSDAVAAAVGDALAHDGWAAVPDGQERAGDAVLLRVQGRPWHCGLVVSPGWMLHVERGCNSVLERYDQIKWRRRVLGFYRIAP